MVLLFQAIPAHAPLASTHRDGEGVPSAGAAVHLHVVRAQDVVLERKKGMMKL